MCFDYTNLFSSAIFLHQFVSFSTRDVMSRASSLADTRICPCQSARGGINYSNQRVLPAQLEICGRGARTRIPRISLSPYVGPKWKDRLARLAVKTSTLVPCVDAYAKSASSVHSQRHPCALTVVHHFWLDGWCRWKEREREREGEKGGEMEEKWSETFMYYIRSLNFGG